MVAAVAAVVIPSMISVVAPDDADVDIVIFVHHTEVIAHCYFVD